MKELEKTKRISIATVLFILVILVGFLTFKRPQNLYTINTKTALDSLINLNYLVSLDEIKNTSQPIIDIRSRFEFEKGHLENAINIYGPEILSKDNTKIFENFKKEKMTVILYGENPNETLPTFMVLNQLGFSNLKILTIKNNYSQNKLISKNIKVERSTPDINGFIKESQKNANVDSKPIVKKAPKRVVPLKKRKKAAAEGGC